MCDDALKTGQSSTFKKVFLISLGVFATAALVLSNTQILLSIDCGPIPATGLAVLHNVVTLIFFRVTSKINLEQTPPSIARLLICVAVSSAVSLLSSNFLLEHSSVSFHQIARIFSIPLGAALDFFMEEKKKGTLETLLLTLICLAAFLENTDVARLEIKVYNSLCDFVTQHSKWKLISIILLLPFCALLYNIFVRRLLPLGYLGYLPVSISTDDVVLGSAQDKNLSMIDIYTPN
jgi:hypothetical protein